MSNDFERFSEIAEEDLNNANAFTLFPVCISLLVVGCSTLSKDVFSPLVNHPRLSENLKFGLMICCAIAFFFGFFHFAEWFINAPSLGEKLSRAIGFLFILSIFIGFIGAFNYEN